MREVKFTKDFANQKKGDTQLLSGQLASKLVHNFKVAKYVTKKAVKEPKKD